MKKHLALVLFVSIAPLAAHADDTSSGCGLGWEVTKSTTLSATTTRGTTDTSLPNTFSMTSGTSGCAKHPIAKNDMPAFEYAVVNHDALTIEMAQGQGENLTAFARTLGCGDGAVARFGQMAQSHYGQITGGGTAAPAEFFDRVKGQVSADPVLSLACRT